MARENQPQPLFRSDHDRVLAGLRYLLHPPVPAAGAEWSAAVPGGRSWRIHAGGASFATSANVGNRVLGLTVVLQGVRIYIAVNTSAIPANAAFVAVYEETYSPATAVAPLATTLPIDVPDFWLPEGCVVSSLTGGLLAGDQYSAIGLLIEERWGSDSDIELGRELDAEAQLEALAAATQTTTGG